MTEWSNKRLLIKRVDEQRDLTFGTMAIFRIIRGRVANKFAVNDGKQIHCQVVNFFVDIHTQQNICEAVAVDNYAK